MFRYDNGRSALFTLTGKTDGGVNEEIKSYQAPADTW